MIGLPFVSGFGWLVSRFVSYTSTVGQADRQTVCDIWPKSRRFEANARFVALKLTDQLGISGLNYLLITHLAEPHHPASSKCEQLDWHGQQFPCFT